MKIKPNSPKFIIQEYNYPGSASTPRQKIRWILPDYPDAINSESIFKVLPPDVVPHAKLMIEIYRLLTIYPQTKTRRKSFTIHNTNAFNPAYFLGDPLFNDRLFQNSRTLNPREIKMFLGRLLKTEREEMLNDIRKKKFSEFYVEEPNYKQLIRDAFYEPLEPYGLSREGLRFYYAKTQANALQIISERFSERDYISNPITLDDVKFIWEELIPDNFSDDIITKEMGFILQDLEKLLFSFIRECRTNPWNSEHHKKFLSLTSQLRTELVRINRIVRSPAKKARITELLEFVNIMSRVRVADGWKGLTLIRDKFARKDVFIKYFALTIETYVKAYFRLYAKTIFEDLCKNYSLTKAEKRLYLFTNVGIPSLYGLHPLFNLGMKQFFKMEPYCLMLFAELIIFKKNPLLSKSGGIYLKDLLRYKWTVFLRIYAMLNEKLIGWQAHENIYQNLTESLSEDQSEEDAEDDPMPDEDTDAEHVSNNVVDVYELSDENPPESNIENISEPILTPRESKIVKQHIVEDIPLAEIAEEQGVSPQMISKIYRRAITKLKNNL